MICLASAFFFSFLFALPCHCIAYIILLLLLLLLVLTECLYVVDSKYAGVQAKYAHTHISGR